MLYIQSSTCNMSSRAPEKDAPAATEQYEQLKPIRLIKRTCIQPFPAEEAPQSMSCTSQFTKRWLCLALASLIPVSTVKLAPHVAGFNHVLRRASIMWCARGHNQVGGSQCVSKPHHTRRPPLNSHQAGSSTLGQAPDVTISRHRQPIR